MPFKNNHQQKIKTAKPLNKLDNPQKGNFNMKEFKTVLTEKFRLSLEN